MATIMPTSPETLIAVKVAIGTNNRRFKLPLRELGANVFESKVRGDF
jgi:next-to-BRCA1 protein 1